METFPLKWREGLPNSGELSKSQETGGSLNLQNSAGPSK